MLSRRRFRAAAAFLWGLAALLRAEGDPRVALGPNVRVSAGANGARLHHEVTMAASPTDAGRLLACSMIFDARDASRHVVAYLTVDGGKTWAPTLEVKTTAFVGDPTCAFGSNGDALLAALPLHYESGAEHETLVYRSNDGGATWNAPVSLPFIDREWLTFDGGSGARKGLLYLHGNAVREQTVDGDERVVFTLFRSKDGGKTFSPPKSLFSDGEHMSFGTGTAVVTSNGAFVASFPEWSDRKNLLESDFKKPVGAIKVVVSEDGGETFQKAVAVSEWHSCQGWTPGLPVLAADASDGPFRDRLYLTWPDRRSGRCEILISRSSDGGKSWSAPLVVNDDQSPADRERGRDHMLPAVAVNRAGVVGVSWYDRREATEDTREWAARFAYSLDGGETFSPNVRVSDPASYGRPSEYLPIMAYSTGGGHQRPRARGGNIQMEIGPQWIDYLCAADTAGMAAGADGVFHPLWVDHRSGIPQLWTAAVRVDGAAAVNGSPELAKLDDATPRIAVAFANSDYDPKAKIVSIDVTLTNTSDKTVLLAPLKLRVVSLRSSIAVPAVLDAENRLPGAGAIWDFSGTLPDGRLAPGATSAAKRLRFRIDSMGPIRLDKRGSLGGLLSVEAKVLAKEERR